MLEYLDSLTLAQLAWIIPIFFLIHFYEEAPHLVHYFHKHPVDPRLRYTQKKLIMENLLLFLFMITTTTLLNIFPDFWLLQGIAVAGAVGMMSLLPNAQAPTRTAGADASAAETKTTGTHQGSLEENHLSAQRRLHSQALQTEMGGLDATRL
jgi:hypothetical protein